MPGRLYTLAVIITAFAIIITVAISVIVIIITVINADLGLVWDLVIKVNELGLGKLLISLSNHGTGRYALSMLLC